MKRLLGWVIAFVGGGVCLVALSSLLFTRQRILDYDAVYVGLAGVGLLTAGLIMRQD